MTPKLVFLTILLWCNQALGIHFVEQFYDDVDVQCSKIVHVPQDTFYGWFNSRMELMTPDNQIVLEYARCWMYREGMIDSKGNIDMDNFNKWATTLVFTYVGKDDLEKYSMDTRKDIINKVFNQCKEKLNFSNNIDGLETKFYNCIIAGVYDS